jgi:hypothetical protein
VPVVAPKGKAVLISEFDTTVVSRHPALSDAGRARQIVRMRDVVADMTPQNLGTPLNVAMPITNLSPKVCKGNDFMCNLAFAGLLSKLWG